MKTGLECTCMNNDNFTVLVSGGGRYHWVGTCTVWPLHSKWLNEVEQGIQIKFCIKLEHSSAETIQWRRRPQLWATGDGQLHLNNVPTHASHLLQRFLVKHQITQVTQAPYSPDLAPCDVWLFPKLKSPLRGKRFQTVDEIQENTTGDWWWLGELCEVSRCLLWRGLRYHCLMYNVSCVLYLLQ